MLAVPKMVRNANLQDPNIRFCWDEWGDDVALMTVDERLSTRLKDLSQRANVAFSSATGEWIVHRFAGLTDVSEPLHCLEAAWVQQIDFGYSWEWSLSGIWTGPVKGPIRLVMDRVSFALEEARDDGDPSWSAATLAILAEYLLSDSSPYISWRTRILERFEVLYPLNPKERLGDVVPREAMDPDLEFDPARTEILINEFLGSVDYRMNPFLKTADMMLKEGFEGTPYVFDLDEDRRRRFEW